MNKNKINTTYNKIKIFPIITYSNLHKDKLTIYKDNIKRSGIYRLNHLVTSYVGLSINLRNRFSIYYSEKAMLSKLTTGKSIIYSALLKHGQVNFSLDILEYCEIDQLISREQYYIDLLKPEYNICKTAGSTLGKIHSESTKEKIKNSTTGKNPRLFGKHHTYETRKNIGKALKLSSRIRIMPKMRSETKLKLSIVSIGVNVKVFDKKDNLIKEFPSINSTAKYFDVSSSTISTAIKKGRSYQKLIFKSEIKDNRIWVYDLNLKLIKVLDNVSKAPEWFNIPRTTLSRYIKSGKLWNNKYYFYNTCLKTYF